MKKKILMIMSLLLLITFGRCFIDNISGNRLIEKKGVSNSNYKGNTYAHLFKEFGEALFLPTTAQAAVHVHSYAPATCTSPATCACGATTGSPLGHAFGSYPWFNNGSNEARYCNRSGCYATQTRAHSFGGWSTTTAATCTAAGSKTRSCSCGASETQSIAALGHNYSSATCTAPATCTRCGATSGSALGHSYNAATCTAPATCSRCGATSGSALGHNYAAATCTAPATCTRCGATSGSALGHSYNAATCTAPATCSRCGATSGSALGHSYTAATCTTPATCARCGATTGSALGHAYGNYAWFDNGSNEARYCNRSGCYATQTRAHSFSAWTTTTEATCTTAGTQTRSCSQCGRTETQSIAALGHAYGNYPWLDNGSNETRYCNRTGCYVAQTRAHSFGAWATTTAATCTTAGIQSRSCSQCGRTETQSIAALGHVYGNYAWFDNGSNEARFCNRDGCSATQTRAHSFSAWATTTLATCTDTGIQTKVCSQCGRQETQSVPALGHAFDPWTITKAATCTDAGTQTRVCSQCRIVETQSIAALGHVYGDYPWRNNGENEARFCNRSGCSVSQTRAHSFSAWTTTTAATCTTAGTQTRSCSQCGRNESQNIDAPGHLFESTWSDNGENEIKRCTRSGCTATTIQAHAFGSWSTNTDGTQSRTCSQCGKTERVPIKPSCSSISNSGSPTTNTTFEVYANGVSATTNVKFAVWTVANGQDDLKWYDGVFDSANNRWKYTINTANHGNEQGDYCVDPYGYNSAYSGGVGFGRMIISVNAPAIPIPAGITANVTSTTLTVSWSAVSGATSYDVNVSGNIQNTTGTSYQYTGLSPSTQYGYAVCAKNSGGTSGYSSTSYINTLATDPVVQDETWDMLQIDDQVIYIKEPSDGDTTLEARVCDSPTSTNATVYKYNGTEWSNSHLLAEIPGSGGIATAAISDKSIATNSISIPNPKTFIKNIGSKINGMINNVYKGMGYNTTYMLTKNKTDVVIGLDLGAIDSLCPRFDISNRFTYLFNNGVEKKLILLVRGLSESEADSNYYIISGKVYAELSIMAAARDIQYHSLSAAKDCLQDAGVSIIDGAVVFVASDGTGVVISITIEASAVEDLVASGICGILGGAASIVGDHAQSALNSEKSMVVATGMVEAKAHIPQLLEDYRQDVKNGTKYGAGYTAQVCAAAMDCTKPLIVGYGCNRIWENNPSIYSKTLNTSDEYVNFYRSTLTNAYIDEFVANHPSQFVGKDINAIKTEMGKLRAAIQATKNAAKNFVKDGVPSPQYYNNDPSEPSFEEQWLVENCAEVWAVRSAIMQGAKVKNIVLRSVYYSNGTIKELCDNCKRTFADYILAMN